MLLFGLSCSSRVNTKQSGCLRGRGKTGVVLVAGAWTHELVHLMCGALKGSGAQDQWSDDFHHVGVGRGGLSTVEMAGASSFGWLPAPHSCSLPCGSDFWSIL